ncbi:MAG: tetratricopeptide repeat protein [Abditibacteriales bacterium]|nr:tetratricopeptide repeat protein [Abditibacteriales bacterium]MDW8366355.1 tetratricopeptide repeat protein [Abditibacteriales bacterium]
MSSSSRGDVERSCQAARQSLQQGQWDAAIRTLREALASEPNHFEALCLLGIALGQQGQTAQGIETLRAALRVNPHSAPAHFNLAQLFQRAGNVQEAIAELEAALRIDPRYEHARSALQALKQPPSPPAELPPQPSAPTAFVCVNHPHLRASDKCRKCGALLCGDCIRVDYGTPFCERCYAEVVKEREERAKQRAAEPVLASPSQKTKEKPENIWTLCWGLVTNPKDTLENRLPEYVDSPGVLGKVVLFYINSTVVFVLVAALIGYIASSRGGQGTSGVSALGVPLGAGAFVVGIFSLFNLLFTVLIFTLINMVFGGGDFVGDFLSLLARFGLVWGTTQLFSAPLMLIAGLIGSTGGLAFILCVVYFWQLILNVLVLMVTYDYHWFTALVVLWFASCLTGAALRVLSPAGL